MRKCGTNTTVSLLYCIYYIEKDGSECQRLCHQPGHADNRLICFSFFFNGLDPRGGNFKHDLELSMNPNARGMMVEDVTDAIYNVESKYQRSSRE